MLKLEKSNVQDMDSKFLISVKVSKTHTNRIFTVVDNEEHTLLNLIRQYISLRPLHTPHQRFFVFYKNNKCSTHPVGINTFSKLPSTIATFLKLDQVHLYTGHCFRRSSASILSESGADFSAIKGLGGWKSTSVAEGYIENSIQSKDSTAANLLCNTETSVPSEAPSTSTNHSNTYLKENNINLNLNSNPTSSNDVSMPSFNFSNCTVTNVNINMYKH